MLVALRRTDLGGVHSDRKRGHADDRRTDRTGRVRNPGRHKGFRISDNRLVKRGGIAVAVTLLLACGAFVTHGVLSSDDGPAEKQAVTPTAEVTYEVLGEGAAR
ncbi:hypothetical protein ACFXI8_14640 [Streptomyces niveus]|uniref:hypothetical protein n=1 Tax=Streptomyces niveus TaxID=193462 RepID=UPI0036A96E06